MMIRRVILENFLSHERTEISFEPGVTLIVGPNGAGKTSIVDAITYALFSDHSRGGKRKDILVRLGAASARIELFFEANGRLYRLRREIPRTGTGDAYLFEQAGSSYKLIARGVKTVESEVARILQLPITTAKIVLVARQGELDQILSSQARKQYMAAVLQLDAMNKTYEKMREIINEVNKRISKLEGIIQEKNAQKRLLEKRLLEARKLEEEKKNLEEKLEKLERKHSKLYHEKKKLEEEIQAIERLEAEKEKLEEQLLQVVKELEEARSELAEARKAANKLKELATLINSLDEVKYYAKLLEDIRETRVRIIEIQDEYREASGVLEDLARLEKLGINERLKNLRRREEELRTHITIYENNIALKKEYEARLATINTEVEKLTKELLSVVQENLGLRSIGLRDPERIYKLIIDYMEKVRSDYEKKQKELENLREAYGRLTSRRESIQQDLDKLASARGTCPLCGQPLTEEHRLYLIRKLREERRQIEVEERKVRETVKGLEKELDELSSLLSLLENLSHEAAKYYHRIAELKRQAEQYSERLREVERNILAYTGAKKEYEELRAEIEKLEKLEEKLEQARQKLVVLKALEEQKKREEEKLRRLEDEARRLLESIPIPSEELTRIIDKLGEIEEYIGVLKERASKLQLLEDRITSLEKREESIRTRLKEASTKLSKKQAILSQYEKLELELESIEEEARNLSRRLGDIEGRLKSLAEDKKRLEKIKEELKEITKTLEGLERTKKDLEKIRKVFSQEGLPKAIRSLARTALEAIMKDILQGFNIDFVDIRIDDDFEIYLIHRSGERTLQMMSGGEKTAVAIAFRLALARLIAPRINVLIMDEPTIHLDEENRRELIRITRWSIAGLEGLHQLIIISHDRELEEAADNIIEVVKEYGRSRILRTSNPEPIPVTSSPRIAS